jgi:hypothetical protein
VVPSPTPPSTTDGHEEGRSERWLKLAANVLAPTTVLTALLIYFGYVSTTGEYGYFGITLGSLELSAQDLALRSIAALYVPLGGTMLVLLLLSWAHTAVSGLLERRAHLRSLAWSAGLLVLLGAAATVRGVVGVVVPEVSRTEAIATSPIALGVGVAALAYGRHVLLRVRGGETGAGTAPARHRTTVLLTGAVVTLSLFWTTSSFAGAYGRGQAVVLAGRLTLDLPGVVLDTTERLYAAYPGLEETRLPDAPDQRFHYRYRGLRLLIEAKGRMYLLPEGWRVADGAALVVPVGDGVRVEVYR